MHCGFHGAVAGLPTGTWVDDLWLGYHELCVMMKQDNSTTLRWLESGENGHLSKMIDLDQRFKVAWFVGLRDLEAGQLDSLNLKDFRVRVGGGSERVNRSKGVKYLLNVFSGGVQLEATAQVLEV